MNNQDQTATITPKENATKRTKERIKEHGPTFTILKHNSHTTAMGCDPLGNGQPATLLKSQKTNWLGWLPHNEINIQVCETCNGTGSFIGNDQHPNGTYIEETCNCRHIDPKQQDKLYILPPLNPNATPQQDPIQTWLDEAIQRLKNNTDYINEIDNMVGTDYQVSQTRKTAAIKENDFITQAINLITAKYP